MDFLRVLACLLCHFGCPRQVNHGALSKGSLCLFLPPLRFFLPIFSAIGFVPVSVLSLRWRDQ